MTVVALVAAVLSELQAQGNCEATVTVDDMLIAFADARVTVRADDTDECGRELASRFRTELASRKQLRLELEAVS